MNDSLSQNAPRRSGMHVSFLAGLVLLSVTPFATGEGLWQPETFFTLLAEETVDLPLPVSADRSNHSFTRQPLSFERNDGQTDSEVAFLSRGHGYTLFLTTNETVLKLCNADFPVGKSGRLENRRYNFGADAPPAEEHTSDSPARVLRMRLSGANPQPSIGGEQSLRAKANYFIGNQPSLWRTNIPCFGKVHYRDVYPGIDLVYYGNEGQLEYDFIVAPGADPNRIAMEFEGADDMRVDEHGDLLLKVGNREVRWQKPAIYQELNGARHEIAGSYTLHQKDPGAAAQSSITQSPRSVSFQLASYDPNLSLVIDPRLVYSTYLGGSAADYASGVAVDTKGNAFVAGSTASLDFPTKAPISAGYAGGDRDAFLAKFNPTGELLFSTYLGGSGNEGWAGDIQPAVNPAGECYLVGSTDSPDFPLLNPLQEWLGGDVDVFVTALSADGSAIRFSTFLGGEDRDVAKKVAIGPTGDIYVVGATRSPSFPTVNAFQSQLSPLYNGYQLSDGFVTRLEAGGKRVIYSTFYGKSANNDQVYDVKVDAEGSAYVVLTVASDSGSQWYIAKIAPDGSNRLFERHWPGTPSQQIMLFPYIAFAPDNRLVVAGSANVVSLPAINKPNSTTTQGFADGYIALFSATNGSYLSARYFGGSGNDDVYGLCLDAAGDIVVSGWTAGPDYQPSGFPVTDSTQPVPNPEGSVDVFVTKFSSADLSLTFSTLVGGSTNDFASGMAMDSVGNVLICGYNTQGQFPTVNAVQPEPGGDFDAFLLKLSLGERLQVSRSGQNLSISWPLSAIGFVLESADSPLAPASGWSLVANPPIAQGDQNVVTLAVGSGSQFFRLKKQ